MPPQRNFVELDQAPRANGVTLGRAAAGALRERVAAVRQMQKERRCPDSLLAARIRDFTRAVRKAAPHWLAEAEGMAEGAGVAADDVLLCNCLPPGWEAAGTGCTSFVRVGEPDNMLFKSRDVPDHAQAFFISCGDGHRRYQAACDVGNLGVAHVLTENALAGANNTGSEVPDAPDEARLSDCHVLRYIAENASRVEDAPEMIERLLTQKLFGAVGEGCGMILLLCDARRGLILEVTADRYTARFVERGVEVVSNHFLSRASARWRPEAADRGSLLRKERMEALLAALKGPPAPQDVFRFARDRRNGPHAICSDDRRHEWMTVSAQLQVITSATPDASVNWVCCGNPRHSVFLRVPLAARESYVPLLSGEFYRAADDLYRRGVSGPRLRRMQEEFEAAAESQDLKASCREALDVLRDAAGP